MIRAFLFDLDGVLTDTSEFHYRAWQRLADEEDLPFDRRDNEALRGVGRRESLKLLLKGKYIDEDTAQEWMERKNRYYVEQVENMTTDDLLPGGVALLKGLRRAGIKVCIASASKNAPLVIDRLKLRPFIDLLVDGSNVTRSKPAPDLFLYAADKLGVHPEECVVVEDATAGIAAAEAAGMHSLGIGPSERVGDADLVLRDLSDARGEEILTFFDRL